MRIALLFFVIAAVSAFDVHDNLALTRLSSFKTSDRWVLYSAYHWNETSNVKTTGLFLTDVDFRVERTVFHEIGVSVSNALFVDSDNVLFTMNDKNGVQNIFSCSLANLPCTPRQISHYPVDVDNIQLSQNGEWIAFAAYVYPSKSLDETAEIDAVKAKRRGNARVFDRLMIRHWSTWETGKWRHVHVVRFKGVNADLGAARDVMPSQDGHSPSEPFGGNEEFTFSPDSKHIAYSVKTGESQAWLVNNNVWLASVADAEISRCLSCDNEGRDMNPVFSPDGQYIAWLSTTSMKDESARNRINIFSFAKSAVNVLTNDWDRTVLSITWSSSDWKHILATTYDDGTDKLYSVDVSTGVVTHIPIEHSVEGVAISATGLVLQISSYEHAAELYTANVDGSNLRRLTKINADFFEANSNDFVTPTNWKFTGAANETVQAWVFPPKNVSANGRYPVALYCHGGPESPWSDQWSYRWNPQILTNEGYFVLAINFHGSPGFGDKFTKSILGDWGGKPFEDQLLGLDAALKQWPNMDAQNIVALGASYGGFTINWMQGNAPPGLFKAMVLHDGIFNNAAMYYATEELWFPESEMGGTPTTIPAVYEKWSPSNYVKTDTWNTPMLVIHGEQDFRIPYTEGISAFTALKRKGVEARLVLFPTENHWVLDPNNSILWHEEVLGWINNHVTK